MSERLGAALWTSHGTHNRATFPTASKIPKCVRWLWSGSLVIPVPHCADRATRAAVAKGKHQQQSARDRAMRSERGDADKDSVRARMPVSGERRDWPRGNSSSDHPHLLEQRRTRRVVALRRARAPPTSSGDQTAEKSNATLTSSSPKEAYEEKEEKDRCPYPPSARRTQRSTRPTLTAEAGGWVREQQRRRVISCFLQSSREQKHSLRQPRENARES
jgi:hypothetical protein